MPVVDLVSVLGLKRLHRLAQESAGLRADGAEPEAAAGVLVEAGPDAADTLTAANRRAWLALETAVAGEAVWDQVNLAWRGNACEPLCPDLRTFLDAVAATDLGGLNPDLRDRSLAELRAARSRGVLTAGRPDLEALTRQAAVLDRLADPENAAQLEWVVAGRLGHELERAGFPAIKLVLEVCSPGGEPLFLATFLHYFCQATGPPSALLQGLTLALEEGLDPEWQAGLEAFGRLLDRAGDRLAAVLDALARPMSEEGPPPAPAGPPELERGIACYNRGEYEQAVGALTAAIAREPTAAAYAYRGDVHRLCCEYEPALADYTAALALEPGNAQVLVNRGLVHQLRGAHVEAVADFTEAIRVSPENAVAHNNRGISYAAQGKPERAIEDFTTALRLDPGYARVYLNRARANGTRGAFADAVADYTQFLKRNASHVPAYLERGEAFLAQGGYDRAAADFTAALRFHPQNARAYARRGDAYRLGGDLDRAVRDYSNALRIDPADATARCHRGVCYRTKGQYERALPDLNRVLAQEPENAWAAYNRGKLYAAWGDWFLAVSDFDQALRLNPQLVPAYLSRALARERQGEVREALRDCTWAARLDADQPAAYLIRGNCRLALGRFDEAVADFGRAIDLDPACDLAHQLRGIVHTHRGRLEEAAADFDRAIALAPQSALPRANRAIVYQLRGLDAQAAADFQKALKAAPELVLGCWTRGLVHAVRENYVAAIAEYLEGKRPAEIKSIVTEAPPARLSGPAERPPANPPAESRAAPTPADESPDDVALQVWSGGRNGVNGKAHPNGPDDPAQTRVRGAAAATRVVHAARAQRHAAPPGAGQPAETADPVVVRVDRAETLPGPAGNGAAAAAPAQVPAQVTPRPALLSERLAASRVKEETDVRPAAPRFAPQEPVHCLTCGTDFYPATFLDDGRVRCPQCNAAVRRHVPAAPKAPPAPKPRPTLSQRAQGFLFNWRDTGPGGRSAGVKALLIVLTLVVLGGGAWVALHWKSGGGQAVDATALWQEYNTKLKSANKAYLNRVLAVTGEAATVKRPQGNSSVTQIIFRAPPDAMWTISCSFNSFQDMGEVNEGDTVTVQGRCLGRDSDKASLVLSACKVLKLQK